MHNTRNGFSIPYAVIRSNVKRIEVKKILSKPTTNGIGTTVGQYVAFPEFEEFLDAYTSKQLDIYDIETVYVLIDLYNRYLGPDIGKWVKHQYESTTVSTTKHLFLVNLLESLFMGVSALDPLLYADILQDGPKYTGRVPECHVNKRRTAVDIVVNTYMTTYHSTPPDAIVVTPPLLIHRLVATLSVILH